MSSGASTHEESRATVLVRVDTSALARSMRKVAIAFELLALRGRHGRKRERLLCERYNLMVQQKLRSPRHGPGWCE